ncbi:ABC transporter permease subunit [Halobacteriales archaeon Cl-PHB]
MRIRKLLRIARWEVTKNAGGVDRRTILVALGAMVLLGAVAPLVAAGGVGLDDGIYRVGVSEPSPYYEVVEADDTFAIRPDATATDLGQGDVDLLIRGRHVERTGDPKSRAAYEELRTAVERYNDDQLRDEKNQTAAFPVDVLLQYQEQEGVQTTVGTGGGDGTTGGTDGGSGTGDGATDGDGGTGGSDGGTGGAGSGGSGGGGSLAGLGSGLSGGSSVSGSPSDISPPFPFQSLVLAFVFVIPLNFLIQAYGSTILSERLNRRGELLLVSPVTRTDIIAGKTLPYFAGALGVEAAIAVGLTYLTQGTIGGLLSVAAVLPLVLLFLSATFLGAMFARSFKELTFVTVTITVTLTSYAFVPAIFTDIDAVALISPLTIVVRDLQGQAIGLGEFVFSVTPPLLTALVFFGLGAGLYREEDMFTQRAIPLKVLDALAGRIRRPWHVGLMSGLLLPFVFVAELLAIAALFALGELSIPLLFALVAIVEEVGKSLHVYAAYSHNRFDRSLRTALVLGGFSGLGFFLAEKLTLIAQLVGLPDLPAGEAALGTGATGPELLLLFLAPLALHVVTATISAVGARKGRRPYLAAIGVAMVVHFAYNSWVVSNLV